MKAPAFWDGPTGWAAQLLQPMGWIYGRITAWRMGQPGADASLPVLCIGNFTAGGAGKTPAAILAAEIALAAGLRPVILSRGYGGRLVGPELVDPARHTAAECGDEPLLIARTAPVVVARDRIAGAALAKQSGGDFIIMDDGLQNPALRKDVTLAVVDGASGIGNGLCLPAGPLRAPLATQFPLVAAVLVIGPGAAGDAVAAAALAAGKPVLRGALEPEPAAAAGLAGRPLFAFAGIGRPDKFFATLAAAGLDVRVSRAFADHHPYGDAEARALLAEADRRGAMLVTTEKDAVRWPKDLPAPAMLPVRLVLSQEGMAWFRQTLVGMAVSGRRSPGP